MTRLLGLSTPANLHHISSEHSEHAQYLVCGKPRIGGSRHRVWNTRLQKSQHKRLPADGWMDGWMDGWARASEQAREESTHTRERKRRGEYIGTVRRDGAGCDEEAWPTPVVPDAGGERMAKGVGWFQTEEGERGAGQRGQQEERDAHVPASSHTSHTSL